MIPKALQRDEIAELGDQIRETMARIGSGRPHAEDTVAAGTMIAKRAQLRTERAIAAAKARAEKRLAEAKR